MNRNDMKLFSCLFGEHSKHVKSRQKIRITDWESLMIFLHVYMSLRTWFGVIEKALELIKNYHFRMSRVNFKYHSLVIRWQADSFL